MRRPGRSLLISVALCAAGSSSAAETGPVVLAVSRSHGDVVVLHPDTLEPIRRFAVGAGPHDIAVSDDGRLAVVPSFGVFPAPHEEPIAPADLQWRQGPSEGLAIVDLTTDDDSRQLALDDCKRPHGAAFAEPTRHIWITCDAEGEIREIDPLSGRTVRVFHVAEGVHKVMLLPERNVLTASNPSAGETYLIELEGERIDRFETGAGAEGLAANPDQSVVYVAQSGDRTVCGIDVVHRALGPCWPSGGRFPIALAVDEAREQIWVAHNASSDLVALSLETGEQLAKIELPSQPLGMAFDARKRRLYVGLPRLNRVLLLDADTRETLATTDTAMEVDDIDLHPASHFGYAPDT